MSENHEKDAKVGADKIEGQTAATEMEAETAREDEHDTTEDDPFAGISERRRVSVDIAIGTGTGYVAALGSIITWEKWGVIADWFNASVMPLAARFAQAAAALFL